MEWKSKECNKTKYSHDPCSHIRYSCRRPKRLQTILQVWVRENSYKRSLLQMGTGSYGHFKVILPNLNIQKVSWDTSETRNVSTFSRRAVRAWLCETRNVISFSRRSIGALHETRNVSTFLRSVRATCETQNISTFSRRLVGASQVISLLPWVWKNPHFIKKVTLSQFELRAGGAKRDVGKSPNVPT